MHVVILTIQESQDYLQKALANGAAGYTLEDSTPADLVRAMRDVVDGQRSVSGVVRPGH